MNSYEITDMIIDDGFDGEEYVTTDFTHQNHHYSITFKKADLEVINSWMFMDETSLPANLSDDVINLIRAEVERKI
ncbi:hypothetical protein [Mesobacillus maritimus]|uniref:hypothetical protein n=1 Tax=Mesobacillus maritimus TaxID=1643336 RepID=UPI00384FAD46